MNRSRLPDALAASGVFLACWGVVHTWFWSHGQLVDWPVYRDYGRAIIDHGRIPYRDFAVEYPPGALPVFVVPAPFGDYAIAFGWLMALCGVGIVAVVGAVSRFAMWFVAVSPLLAGSLILSHFDLWPALLATSALVLLVRDRPGWAWALLGLAIAAKLWPAVLVPLFLVRSRRGAGWGVLTLAIAFVPFLVLAPGGVWHSISGQASRPLQIESLPAAFLTTFGSPHIVSGHGSQNVAGNGGFAAVASCAQLLALVGVWVSYARSRRELERHSAAAVTAFIAFGKVLSPQFLLWLAPLVPLVRGRRGAAAVALLTAAFVLTQVWFPQHYWDYVDHQRLAGVVLVRDLVLVALLGVLALPGLRRTRG